MKRIISVAGARPNFMKIVPLQRELAKIGGVEHILVHTGQHYDFKMSGVFFEELGLPEPDKFLGVGSGGHGLMTGKIMIEFEKVCQELEPDMIIVVGDVNSTIAASLVARKLFIPVAHVEAGLRSFDEAMPEELNRRLTDALSNLLFVSEPAGMENLKREGTDMSRAHLVGDIMLETLQMFLPAVSKRARWENFGLEKGEYCLATAHRPSNVDAPQALTELIELFEGLDCPILLPLHPRTLKRLSEFGLKGRFDRIKGLTCVAPESYLDFLSLMQGARLILSDSGSVQSESALFNVPCLVMRENTERPIYLEKGTSSLVGRNRELVLELYGRIKAGTYKQAGPEIPEIGRNVARKTVRILAESLGLG